MRNNAAVSKDKSNSDLCTFAAGEVLYQLCFRNEGSGSKQPQAQPKKYCAYCVLEEKAQVQSSAVVSKER